MNFSWITAQWTLPPATVDTSASHSGHYRQPQWTLPPATVDTTASHSGHWSNVQRHCNGDSASSRCGKSRRTNVWGKFHVLQTPSSQPPDGNQFDKRPQRPSLLVLYSISLPTEVRARHVSLGSGSAASGDIWSCKRYSVIVSFQMLGNMCKDPLHCCISLKARTGLLTL